MKYRLVMWLELLEKHLLEIIKNNMSKTNERNFSFKIGADPEFSIILQNKRIDACQTMSEILRGKKEFKPDDHDMGFNVGKYGNIGWDGASQTGEIRPAPANTPEEVVRNMAELFNALGKYMSIFEYTTLSSHASIGGHIHLEADNSWNGQKQKSIHMQMTSFYLPILMSENKVNVALRIQQNYGAMTDFRFENKGRNEKGEEVRTYEFRCPSAEWLTSPKIAQATLAYFATIYNEILNNPKNIKKCKDLLLKSEKMTEAFQTMAIQEYGLLNKTILRNIARHVRTFTMYPAFKDEIEFILKPDLVAKEKMKFNYDINLGWGLSSANKITKREITSEKAFKDKLKTKDADVISKMVHIDYNSDAKVSDFVNALSLRAGAFNWKLGKQYFIFGLKKGIKDIIVRTAKGVYLSGTDQLKTISDYTLVGNAFDKMARKYADTGNIPNITTIDFKTGQPVSMRDSVMLIGLPYDMRMEGKTKNLIDMVWKIESGALKPCLIEQNKLSDEPGEIDKAKAAREQSSEDEQAILARVDNGNSQSAQNQRRAIERMQQQGQIENSNHDEDDELEEHDTEGFEVAVERAFDPFVSGPQGRTGTLRATALYTEEMARAREEAMRTINSNPNGNNNSI